MRQSSASTVTSSARTQARVPLGRTGSSTSSQPGRSPVTSSTSGAPEAMGFSSRAGVAGGPSGAVNSPRREPVARAT